LRKNAQVPTKFSNQPPEKQQLFKNNMLLEDAKKLADLKIENDDVLAVAFQQDGEY
jgi:transcription elongation factor B subunit 2